MKIAFIEPSPPNVEPVGIEYLAQVLMNEGHEVKYFEVPRRKFLERLLEFKPDVLAYSITTGKHRLCRNLNAVLRRHIKAISLFGGPHCTFYPEFIESSEMIDAICQGEGEYAMAELLRKIQDGKDYTDTANWWVRANGSIHRNDVRNKIEDLDTLPFPNRDIIYAENRDLHDSPIKRVLTSRGCPFSCSYCFNKRYNFIYQGKGKVYRQRSPANIIEEVLLIKKEYPFTFLKIVDDIFGLNMDYGEFADLYSKKVGIPFLCNIRPNLIDEDKIKQLKRAGCVAVAIAVESGNDFIRNKILNRNISREVLIQAVAILKREGIRIWSQNIIGNPGETFEMALETFNFNAENKINFGECSLMTPFPGTDIYKYCVENKYFDGEIDQLSKSYWLGSNVRFRSKEEERQIVNFHKFFSFGVQHPRMLVFIKILIKLPPNRLFVFFNRFYDVWRISRVIRAKFSIMNLLTTIRANLEFIISYFLGRADDYSRLDSRLSHPTKAKK